MKESKEQQSESRVKVGKLPQAEKEIEDREARKIKGQGGASGGVNGDRSQPNHIGEEIPQ